VFFIIRNRIGEWMTLGTFGGHPADIRGHLTGILQTFTRGSIFLGTADIS